MDGAAVWVAADGSPGQPSPDKGVPSCAWGETMCCRRLCSSHADFTLMRIVAKARAYEHHCAGHVFMKQPYPTVVIEKVAVDVVSTCTSVRLVRGQEDSNPSPLASDGCVTYVTGKQIFSLPVNGCYAYCTKCQHNSFEVVKPKAIMCWQKIQMNKRESDSNSPAQTESCLANHLREIILVPC